MLVVGFPQAIAACGVTPQLRLGSSANNKRDGDQPARTDNGNFIVDLHFARPLAEPAAAAAQLKGTTGVVEHGLFCGMASEVIVASKGKGVYTLAAHVTARL